jgi:hypothetical protein
LDVSRDGGNIQGFKWKNHSTKLEEKKENKFPIFSVFSELRVEMEESSIMACLGRMINQSTQILRYFTQACTPGVLYLCLLMVELTQW